jgi:hypothetical protein
VVPKKKKKTSSGTATPPPGPGWVIHREFGESQTTPYGFGDALAALFADIAVFRAGQFHPSADGHAPNDPLAAVPQHVRFQSRDITRVLALVATLEHVPQSWLDFATRLIDAQSTVGTTWYHTLANLFLYAKLLPADPTRALRFIRDRLRTSTDTPAAVFDTNKDAAALAVLRKLYDARAKRWRIADKGERHSKRLWTPWGAARLLAAAFGVGMPEKGEARRDHKAERARRPEKPARSGRRSTKRRSTATANAATRRACPTLNSTRSSSSKLPPLRKPTRAP